MTNGPVIDALRARRSVRHFTSEAAPHELVARVIEEAAWAPSGGDDQPWGVVALQPDSARRFRDRYEMRAWYALAPKMASIVERHAGPAPAEAIIDRVLEKLTSEARSMGTPWLLFVHGPARVENDTTRLAAFRAALESRVPKGELPTQDEIATMLGPVHEGVIAASIAGFVYALALAAHAHGLATCIQHNWLVWRDAIARELGLASDRTVAAGLLLGFGDGQDPVVKRAVERATRRPVDVRYR
ncbi:MAG: nitroreductase family protein [Polyangiaceae bacterium]